MAVCSLDHHLPEYNSKAVFIPPPLADRHIDFIALVKAFFFNPNVLIFFLFLRENTCCEYSLEAPHRGASNEYPQHVF